jgi:alkylhydroperoxidase/carboxymuconolactone decarboxylase family protein YurZ
VGEEEGEMNGIQQTSEGTNGPAEAGAGQTRMEARLQDLIPIVMVIVGGCEPCAEKMVARALQEGSLPQDIDRTLRIVGGMQRQECFAKAVGNDVIERMEKPLAAGIRTLEEAMNSAGKCSC